ncbi:FAD/NAD(P)-binding domain-containing protein, partial [Aspergillus indologenus CBS 114.80]
MLPKHIKTTLHRGSLFRQTPRDNPGPEAHLAASIPQTDYEVIVIGGGPSGLSALSSLSRVRRRTILFDSGEYRNAPTREMHDVIGNDGTPPAEFRGLAREQIRKYDTATIVDTTITTVTPASDPATNTSYFRAQDVDGRAYTARKVVLGTGLIDVLPSVPGLEEAWGQGAYWCPWCDGVLETHWSRSSTAPPPRPPPPPWPPSTYPAWRAPLADGDSRIDADGKIVTAASAGMRTSRPGVFAVGDASNDGSTHVPHAMFSGKRAGAFLHVEMAREESAAAVGKREAAGLSRREMERETARRVGDEMKRLWERVLESREDAS